MKILLCAFVLLLLPANCLGQGPITLPDQSFSAGPDIENAATGASTINQNPPGSVAHHLTERFYRAVKHSYDNGFVPAYDEFTQLRAVAQRHGYESMPDFSFELLNRARRSAEEGHAEEASRLVSIAALLSSRDPRVNFAAASFYQVIGVRRAVSCVLRGLRQMVTYPVLFGLCAVNLFLALLLAFTVSFFTVCVVQLVRSGEELLALCVSFSRGRYRLLIGRSMLLLLFVVPLGFGILAASGCWGLALSKARESCRWLAALCGAVALCWAFGIPVAATLGYNASLEANRVIEEMNNAAFSPKGETFLLQQLRHNPSDVLLLFTLGRRYQSHGEYAEAKRVYDQLLGLLDRQDSLRGALEFNLGVLAYQTGRLQEAKNTLEQLEQSGNKTFELFYNFSLIHLALLDMPAYRAYYAKAKEIDRSKIALLEELNPETKPGVLACIPVRYFHGLLFAATAIQGEEVYAQLEARQQAVRGSLLRFGSTVTMTVFGLLLLLFGIILRSAGQRRAADAAMGAHPSPSMIWISLPAGLFMAGARPLSGALLLALMVVPLVLGLEYPVRLYSTLPFDASFAGPSIVASLLLFVIVAGWSVYEYRASLVRGRC